MIRNGSPTDLLATSYGVGVAPVAGDEQLSQAKELWLFNTEHFPFFRN
jgi:hypothetical protein